MRSLIRNPAPEGLLLYNLRIHADITQDQLAQLMGVSHTLVGMWEVGRLRASVWCINRFCDVMEVDQELRESMLDLRASGWDPKTRKLAPRPEKLDPEPKKLVTKRVKEKPGQQLFTESGEPVYAPPVPVGSSIFSSFEDES